MKNLAQAVVFGLIVTVLGVAIGSLSGCGRTDKKDAKSEGKMATDKMATDKMATDKMATDKMATDKMATDKMATDKDKMATDKK